MTLCRFVPESPRWLLAHGYIDESFRVIQKYGSKDKNKPVDPEHLKAMLEDIRANQVKTEKQNQKFTLLDLVRTPKIRKWTLAVGFQW